MKLSLVLLGLFGLTLAANDAINKDIVIKKYERKIDLSTQLVKIVNKITIENTGASPVKYFLFVLSNDESENLSFIEAQVGNSALKLTKSVITGVQDGFHFYRMDLKDAVQPGKTSSPIQVEVVLSKALTPFPAAIRQGEKQLVLFDSNHLVPSAYKVSSQTTIVTLPSPNIESFSRHKPTTHSDTTITYGPYDASLPFAVSKEPMRLHYESNGPFLTISHMERTLEVSHWGNIAVEETIDLLHSGAKLKGPFSRYDYQRDHNAHSVVKSFRTVLPASAKDVYYRDEIGNISTSDLRVRDDSVELDLRPRFPLFGGWKTHYKLGYNVPSYEYLFYSGNQYALRMRILDHVFEDMTVDEIVLKIILPERVSDVQLSTPFPVKREEDTKHPTYLDTEGRLVVTVRASRLSSNHIQDFVLTYKFSSVLMLVEPMLVVTAFFALFVIVMIWVRLDLTLSPDKAVEAKMKVSSYCSQLASHQHSRISLYHAMLDEISKQHGLGNPPKALAQFQSNIKKIMMSVNEESQMIGDLIGKIRSYDHSQITERVGKLQKLDKELCEPVTQQCSNLEKLLAGKMTKMAYSDAEALLTKKTADALSKCRSMVARL